MSDRADYQRIKELVGDALEVPAPEREELLKRLAPQEPELRARARELLSQEDPAADFLSGPLLLPGARFAGYRLLRLVGRGGSSLVFEAQQASPRRPVALKVLVHAGEEANLEQDENWLRFQAEGEVLARLDHPGIARVIETGNQVTEEGATAFLAVEWIEGARDLVEYAEAESLDSRSRSRLMVQVSQAVAHAQARGVVHRDLKPGNVLVDRAGRPRVIDFGVARWWNDIGESRPRTRHGGFVGTLAYASPEQCGGDPDRIGPATDVHALGVMLYELHCGRLPFALEGKSITEALALIQHHPPRKPLDPGVQLAKDLDAVLSKALAKDPDQRYPDAQSFADDLQRQLDGHPVLARPPSPWADVKLFVRRHRGATLSALMGLLAIAIGTLCIGIYLVRARELEALARERAQVTTDFITSLLSLANPRENRPQELDARSLLDAASKRLSQNPIRDPGAAAELHATLGNAYRELGHHQPAIAHVRRALELYRGVEPRQTLVMIGMLNVNAHALIDAGDFEAATLVLEEALSLQAADPSSPTFLRAITRSHLARVSLAMGELEAAEAHADFSLETYRRELGPRHLSVPRALNTLVGVHLQRGQGEQARPLAEEALAIDLEQRGEDSMLSARSRFGLARVLRALGQEARAAEEAELAQGIYGHWLPSEHRERLAVESFLRGDGAD